ncbi:MAG: hypothetical protein IJP81_00465 [Bacteroidales bacterium]|nr:hypothetical protein [Bacteroidales bacterium]
MEKRVIIGLVAGVMTLSVLSCAKEQQKDNLPENPNGLITEVLSATKEGDATKVTMNSNRQFGWSISDQVAFTIDKKDGTYYFKDSDTYGATQADKFTLSYPETHTRTGYAVIPSTFAGGYDGSTLTVTYPETYDISADVDGGCYDNADAAHFIPFPMVSVSDPLTAALTFYSIGALAKVTVSAVPAGTKNLYITFNKPVTGNFTVANPNTATPQVSCSGESNTTVTVKISESGLTSQQTITLYIPIPVCDAGLQVITSLTTPPKAAMVRNRGYAFATDAIGSLNGGQPYFTLGGSLYEMAPGNLCNTNGVSGTWSFLSNQLMTQLTKHTVAPGDNERDIFTLDELKSVFYNTSANEEADLKGYTLGGTIGTPLNGKDGTSHSDWKMITYNLGNKLINNNTSTGMVGATEQAHFSRVLVDVSGSEMSSYALLDESFANPGTKYVYGTMLFPNNYFDITDLVTADVNGATGTSGRTDKPIITYDIFTSMVNAGAIFLPANGYYYYHGSPKWSAVGTRASYHTGTVGDQYTAGDTHTPYHWYTVKVLNPTGSNDVPMRIYEGYRRKMYAPVRLIRSVTEGSGDNDLYQGDNWSWD